MKCQVLFTAPAGAPEWAERLLPEADCVRAALGADVLDRIGRGVFDAVVCRADGDEALDAVARIRLQSRRVPLILVGTCTRADFEERARQAGATTVVRGGLEDPEVARTVVGQLHVRVDFGEGRHPAESRHRMRRELLPLLVRNGNERPIDVERAFQEAGLRNPLPVMGSLEEAMAYLGGMPPYGNRNDHPLPGVILFELTPTVPGPDFLRWLRSRRDLASLPVIVLSHPSVSEETQRACVALANSFLVKPDSFDGLVAMLKLIDHYWTRMNVGLVT